MYPVFILTLTLALAFIIAIPFNYLIYRRILLFYIPLPILMLYVLCINTFSKYCFELETNWIINIPLMFIISNFRAAMDDELRSM